MVVVASNTQNPISSEDELESEVEFVESFVPQKPSQVKRRTPPTQLHTPPLSHSSADAPEPRHTIPSPPRPSSPYVPAQSIPPMTTTPTPVSPVKPRFLKQRSPTPEVIEISDDDIPALGRTSYSPSPPPPPPPSPPSVVRARSRAFSVVPEVVIRTLPPRLSPTKPNAPPQRSQPNYPIETTRTKSPSPEPPAKASPTKKSVTRKPKSPQKITEKGVRSRSRTQAVRTRSVSRDEGKDASKGDSSSKNLLHPTSEIGEEPTTSIPAASKPIPLRGKSSPRNRTSQKRKRISSEHETSPLPYVPTTASKGKTGAKPREVTNGEALAQLRGTVSDALSVRPTRSKLQQPSRSSSKSRHVTPSDHDSHSSSEEDTNYQRRRVTRRFASVSTPSNIQPPYTPHATPLHHPGMYPPIADPRAQQIVTQAMQQLAALLWTPAHSSTPGQIYPYTPTHHRFSSVGPGFIHSTPDHPHPYPYSFDPSMSKATLPPSSPEPPSSPIRPRERRKSLVSRSRSRGRRVSFHVEEGVSWSESEETESSPLKASVGRRTRKKPEEPSKRSKGKEKAVTRYRGPSSESEAEQDDHSEEENGNEDASAMSKRAQTPGPELQPKEQASSVSSTRLRSPNKASSKPRTRRDGGSRY